MRKFVPPAFQIKATRTRDGSVAIETQIDTRNITLFDLAEYEEYCVVVSGGTYVGFGPYGTQHCAFTQEDSKCPFIIYFGVIPRGGVDSRIHE